MLISTPKTETLRYQEDLLHNESEKLNNAKKQSFIGVMAGAVIVIGAEITGLLLGSGRELDEITNYTISFGTSYAFINTVRYYYNNFKFKNVEKKKKELTNQIGQEVNKAVYLKVSPPSPRYRSN